MAIYFSPLNLIPLLVFFSSLVFLVRRQRRNQKQSGLPPGPWRLPLIGSLHHLMGGQLPHRTLSSLAQKYGPIMYLNLAEIPTVVISSPSLAKQVLKTHDPAFADRPLFTTGEILCYSYKDIALTKYGDYWRQMGKICTLQLLSAKMVKSFSVIRHDELESLISSIRHYSKKGTGTSTMVNMTEKTFRFTNSVACRAAFGRSWKNRSDEFMEVLKDVTTLTGGFLVADLFPSWKLLHNISGGKTRLVNAHHKMDALLEEIINEHIDNKGNKGRFVDEDIVDVLLRMKENDELQFPITNDNIKAVLFDVFGAGSETSSATVIWALSEMMKHPNVMIKAQNEVRQVFEGKKTYDENDLEKLIYLKLVIKETLRLHPPLALVPRECREQTDIGEYTIRQKTKVLVNVWALARDSESWHDPESFIPERFENSSIDFMGDQFEFIPFGAGRRICPGMQFGLANVGLPLAHLLFHFDWELPHGTNPKDLDMTEAHGLTVAKKKDLYLITAEYH